MQVHILDRTGTRAITTLRRIVNGSVSFPASERGEAQIVVPSSVPEMHPATPLSKGMQARIYDERARLRFSGYISRVVRGNYETTIGVVDFSEELRLLPVPPVTMLNGYVVSLIQRVLAYVPAINGQRWSVGDVSKAINSWTVLDASKSSIFEALSSLCEQTGNWFRIVDRVVDIYAEPLQVTPILHLQQGVPSGNSFVIQRGIAYVVSDPSLEIVSDQIYAGIFPEGSSYQDLKNINRTVRLNGDESVPSGYQLFNLWGFWGVFDTSKVGATPLASLPDGIIRSEVFDGIYPIANTNESIDVVVEDISGLVITSAALDGYDPDHWKGAKVSAGKSEAKVVASVDDRITLDVAISVAVGDHIDLSIFREWNDERLAEARQALATASVAFLKSHSDEQVSIQVIAGLSDTVVRPGDLVHLRYAGGATITTGALDRYVQTIALTGPYAVKSLTLTLDQSVETETIVLVSDLWLWPSSSGLREILAILARRLPNAGNGTVGAGYTLQFMVPISPDSPECSGGHTGTAAFGVTFYDAPQIAGVEVLASGFVATAETTTTAVSVCVRGAELTSTIYVRVTIVAGATLGAEQTEQGDTNVDAGNIMLLDAADRFSSDSVEGALAEIANGSAITDAAIMHRHIAWGLQDGQVNADSVPLIDQLSLIKADSVEGALAELAERIGSSSSDALDQLTQRVDDLEANGCCGDTDVNGEVVVETIDAFVTIRNGCIVAITWKATIVSSDQQTAMVTGMLMGAAMNDTVYGGS